MAVNNTDCGESQANDSCASIMHVETSGASDAVLSLAMNNE
jgi:hypothetical protein